MRIHAQNPDNNVGYAENVRAFLTQGSDPHNPYPTGLVRSSYWRVFADGEEAIVYDTPVTRGGPQSFTTLPKGAQTIRAVYHSTMNKAEVLPRRNRFIPQISGNEVSFTMGSACHALIETNGTIGHPLVLFSGDHSTVPDPDDENVLWFEPGLHRISPLELKSNQTLYLEAGSILVPELSNEEDTVLIERDWAGKTSYQDLIFARNQHHIRICGSGIIDTTSLDWHARRTIIFESCENVDVSGITMIGACSWTMPFYGCRYVHVDGIRMLAYRENSDGIDLVDCHCALVENCFIRTGDDAICLKSMAFTPQVETHDILVRNCCVWNDKVRAFGVAGETRHNVYHARFEHCDVVHSFADWTTEVCALGVYICDAAEVYDITFRDIDIRQESNHAVCCCIVKDKWSTDEGAGQIHDILFEQIHFPEDFTMVLIGYDDQHPLRNVRFENCTAGVDQQSVSALRHVDLMRFTENVTEKNYTIPTDQIRIRDPFIMPDQEKRVYYLFGTTDSDPWKGKGEGFLVYESKDLYLWAAPQYAFVPPEGFWATTQFWAPEVHLYHGKWYMFASFRSPERCRGVQILRADCVTGPYVPLTDGPVTPEKWECLDGTLYVDEEGQPLIVFSHEWTQIHDGAFCCAKLSTDLKCLINEPITMFHASEAPWSTPNTGDMVVGERSDYVTDGPYLYHAADGALRMIWSSFSKVGYAIGVAESESGLVTGPWKQQDEPLVNIGGHGMIFDDFSGKTYLALHSPNTDHMERTKLIPFVK